jgi:aspartyl-tRNA(Asn)/glutamyl-tRNA(Gln) amidotransferase subunit A
MAPALADDRLYRVGAALERELAQRWGSGLLDQLATSAAGEYLGVGSGR